MQSISVHARRLESTNEVRNGNCYRLGVTVIGRNRRNYRASGEDTRAPGCYENEFWEEVQ